MFKSESIKKYNISIGIICLIMVLSILFCFYKHTLPETRTFLSPPSMSHWFGTDMTGNDVFLKSTNAIIIAGVTLIIVLPAIYVCGLFAGILLSYFDSPMLREFFLNLAHYWITLPILLIAIFLLILVGAGQGNVIGVLIFVLIPSQTLYVYNQLEEVKKQNFVIAKTSYGFSKGYIFLYHLFPYIRNSFNTYTLSRMPEILLMDLAFNFLGLGVQSPQSSFGKMLYEGLAFMFSAWWLWVFPATLVTLLFVLVNRFLKSLI